jgi:outer membrane protein assembly factor BamB
MFKLPTICLLLSALTIILSVPISSWAAQSGDSSWPMFGHDAQHTGRSQVIGPQTDNIKWAFATASNTMGDIVVDEEGTIYFAVGDKLYAIDKNSSIKWIFLLGASAGNPAITPDGTIYIRAGAFYAINPDGTLKWTAQIAGSFFPVVASDGTIYFLSAGMLVALDQNGIEKWRTPLTANVFAASTPAVASDGTVYISLQRSRFDVCNGQLFAIDSTGRLKWSISCTSWTASPAIGADNTIYIPQENAANLFAVNPDGTGKWFFISGFLFDASTPAIGSDGTIYLSSLSTILTSINPDGTLKWHYTTQSDVNAGRALNPAIGSDGTIYVGIQAQRAGVIDNKVFALDPDGSTKWIRTLDEDIITSNPVTGSEGTLYIAGAKVGTSGIRDGTLYAFGGTVAGESDTDQDCLTNEEEQALGTDPENPDTDGDGLFDGWEATALDPGNNCGDLSLDLPGLGANPLHKDIFLEIDYMDCTMEGGDCPEGDVHTHKPNDDALKIVKEAFANAPVDNPDGKPGITLHINVSNAISHKNSTSFIPEPLFDILETEFDEIKKTNFPADHKQAFHYALFAHAIFGTSGTTGIAERPGNDLMVTLGARFGQTGTISDQAGTLMHELGHNLGFRHGGADNKGNKPNYLSVMNYFFQVRGIQSHVPGTPPTTRFDYSKEALPILDEERLDEFLGIRNGDDLTQYFCPGSPSIAYIARGNDEIDWNCNGMIDINDVEADINNDNLENKLAGYDDWATLVYRFQDTPEFADGVRENVTPPEEELDHETIENLALDHPFVEVTIDIKPGSFPNSINLKSKGVVPLAIISSSDFDATTVIPGSVSFAGSTDLQHNHIEDVNSDGLLDLVLHFNTQSLSLLQSGSIIGALTGNTTDEKKVFGQDSIIIVSK